MVVTVVSSDRHKLHAGDSPQEICARAVHKSTYGETDDDMVNCEQRPDYLFISLLE